MSEEERVEEAAASMERDADEMQHDLDKLEDDIDDAKAAKDKRPEADSDIVGDVAGDWEDEATGASQGEDAEDSEGEKAPEAHDREGSTEDDG